MPKVSGEDGLFGARVVDIVRFSGMLSTGVDSNDGFDELTTGEAKADIGLL